MYIYCIYVPFRCVYLRDLRDLRDFFCLRDLRIFLRLRLRRLRRAPPPFRGIDTFGAPTPPGKLAHSLGSVGVPGHETGAGIIIYY